jgi:hypothetical protein
VKEESKLIEMAWQECNKKAKSSNNNSTLITNQNI